MDSAQTNSIDRPNTVVTADVGDDVTLHCFRLNVENTDSIIWYKQIIGHKPQEMVTIQHEPSFKNEFKSAKFSIGRENGSCHLKIAKVEQSDEAVYYCGFITFATKFTNGTFLSVKGK